MSSRKSKTSPRKSPTRKTKSSPRSPRKSPATRKARASPRRVKGSPRRKREVTIIAATADTPAMSRTGETDKERMHLTPAEFGQQLSLLSADVKSLVKVARKVGALKPGQKLKLADGQEMGAKELNALVTRHTKTLKTLKKNYTARGTRKKRAVDPSKTRNNEFSKGSFLRQPLLDFVSTANFGGVNGPSGGQNIRDVLRPLLEAGLLSRAILTILFTIYEFANGLRTEVNGKKYFSAGPDMERHLGPYLTALENADRAKTEAQLMDKKGNVKPRFDRNRFVYNRLQSIVQPGLFPTSELDADRVAYLDNPQVKKMLADTETVLSGALKAWNPK